MKKQTQNSDKRKRRKIALLATLIPVGAIAAATAITLPLVLNKKSVGDKDNNKVELAADVQAEIESQKWDEDGNLVIVLKSTSPEGLKVIDVDVAKAGMVFTTWNDYKFDIGAQTLTINKASLDKVTGKIVIDPGVGEEITSGSGSQRLAAIKKIYDEKKSATFEMPIGVKAASSSKFGEETPSYGVIVDNTHENVWNARFKGNVISGQLPISWESYAVLGDDATVFWMELEAAQPWSVTDNWHYYYTDKAIGFYKYDSVEELNLVQSFKLDYNHKIYESVGEVIGGSGTANPTVKIQEYIYDEQKLGVIEIQSDNKVNITNAEWIFSKSENAYPFQIEPTSAITGHFELQFVEDGNTIILGESAPASYDANKKYEVTLVIDATKYSSLKTHQKINLNFVSE